MELLMRIERHLRRSAISATRFSCEVMNDPSFVRQLRRGREPRPETVARVTAYLAAAERGGEGCDA